MASSTMGTGLVAARQEDLFSDAVLRFFDAKELMALRPVCKYARDAADKYIWTRFTSFSGASSVVPKYTTSPTLRAKVREKIAQIPSGSKVRIASDQITDAAFFRGLLGPSLTLVINVGTRAPNGGVGTLPGDARQVQGPTTHGKAHAKFITGGDGVLLGSPNYTPNALSGGTVESAVNIRNLQVKAYFNRYFDLMRGGTRQEDQQFTRMLNAFNRAEHPVSLALAPFVEIQPWLLAELAGYDRLVIRMFLISYLRDGQDIVGGLNAMARKNPRMTIDVYVDEGQVFDTFSEYFDRKDKQHKRDYYVWQACQYLMAKAPNVRVFTQKGTSGIMHDKLILAEKDIETPEGQRAIAKRVIMGSSGFSQHVMNNANWDIMVRIDQLGLFEYMMTHHKATLESKAYNTQPVKRSS